MINTIVMQGRLTLDPVLKTTMTGKELCVFSIAQNYRHGETQETDYFDIKTFDAQAKYVCDYFRKGDIITVAGKVRSRRYEGSDGVKRVAFEIIAQQIGDKERPRQKQEDGAFEEVG